MKKFFLQALTLSLGIIAYSAFLSSLYQIVDHQTAEPISTLEGTILLSVSVHAVGIPLFLVFKLLNKLIP